MLKVFKIRRLASLLLVLCGLFAFLAGCGKKAPPKPPVETASIK